jgi:hypothetical protein
MTRNSVFWKLSLTVAVVTALVMLQTVLSMDGKELMNLGIYLVLGYGVAYSTIVTVLLVIFLPEKRVLWSYWVKVWAIITLSVYWVLPYISANAKFF